MNAQAFAVRDEMVAPGDYGNAMVIINQGEAVVHHVHKHTLESCYYHARVKSWQEGAPTASMQKESASSPCSQCIARLT